MSTKIEDLLAQRAAIDAAIKTEQTAARRNVVSEARKLLATVGLTCDVKPLTAPVSTGVKVPPKWRNPSTGETWTGRGKSPLWMGGSNIERL